MAQVFLYASLPWDGPWFSPSIDRCTQLVGAVVLVFTWEKEPLREMMRAVGGNRSPRASWLCPAFPLKTPERANSQGLSVPLPLVLPPWLGRGQPSGRRWRGLTDILIGNFLSLAASWNLEGT